MQKDAKSPFLLTSVNEWAIWRQKKLDKQLKSIDELRVLVDDPGAPTAAEATQLCRRCDHYNLALFRTDPHRMSAERIFITLCAAVGLHLIDRNIEAAESGVSAIAATPGADPRYIPYTNRQLSWHTDGYYNAADRQIKSWALYCVRQSLSGGESELLDHELLYLIMRDEEPAMISALMQPDVMTIPANLEHGREIRPASIGPVFAVDDDGRLRMRYSARSRNILWKNDRQTRRAVGFMHDLLSTRNAPIIRYRLRPGEGIISNNVLHRRSSFEDGEAAEHRRLLWRARFYDAVSCA
jgi:hypothetical protein